MSRREDLVELLSRTGIVGVVREDSAEAAWEVAKAYADNGIQFVEITLTTPDAFDLITRVARRYEAKGVIVAAGTVRGSNDAAEARRAGAQALVSPHTDLRVLDYALEHDLMSVAGAATATEIIHAWEAGASVVKIYPAAQLGGPEFIKTIRQPIRDAVMLAGGFVPLDMIEKYLEAGCIAVNLGGSLAVPDLVAAKRWDDIGRRALLAASIVRSRGDRPAVKPSVVH